LRAEDIPVRLHICGNITPLLPEIGKLGCASVDLDWMVPVEDARRNMGPDQVVCGNLDPVAAVLQSTPERIHAACAACHAAAGPRYLLGAGCEIPRGTPPENLKAMRDFAKATQP
jgi:uroporphyrinogen-III decarboxylase